MRQIPDVCIDMTVTSPPYDNLRTYNGFSFNFESVAQELYRVTKQGGVAVWVVGDATIKGSETGTSFRQVLYFKEIGFKAVKNNTGRVVKEYGVRTNVWEYQIGKWKITKDADAYRHPAIFPEALARDHIISWSNPGDLVFDPFVGSGTTAKMALLEGRNYLGIDISEEYCNIARQRIEGINESQSLLRLL